MVRRLTKATRPGLAMTTRIAVPLDRGRLMSDFNATIRRVIRVV